MDDEVKEEVQVIIKGDCTYKGVLLGEPEDGNVSVMIVEPVNLLKRFKKGNDIKLKFTFRGNNVVDASIEKVVPPATIFVVFTAGFDIGELSGEERRTYIRVDDFIPLEVKTVLATETDRGFSSGLFRDDSMMAMPRGFGFNEARHYGTDKIGDLKDIMLTMNAKIDFLIKYLLMKEERGFEIPRRKKVSISGTGLLYGADVALPHGEYVEILMILPQAPPRTIIATCRVVRCLELKDEENQYSIGLTFDEIDENDREAIIQYTVQKQIRDIRRKKEEEADG